MLVRGLARPPKNSQKPPGTVGAVAAGCVLVLACAGWLCVWAVRAVGGAASTGGTCGQGALGGVGIWLRVGGGVRVRVGEAAGGVLVGGQTGGGEGWQGLGAEGVGGRRC